MGVPVERHILGFAWICMLDQVTVYFKQVRIGHMCQVTSSTFSLGDKLMNLGKHLMSLGDPLVTT